MRGGHHRRARMQHQRDLWLARNVRAPPRAFSSTERWPAARHPRSTMLTPAFSNRAPAFEHARYLATAPGALACASAVNTAPASTSASALQMSVWSSEKIFAARSKRSDTCNMLPSSAAARAWTLMSAAIRLVRALRVFVVIFLSYMWQVSWARLWPARLDRRARWKVYQPAQRPADVQGLRPAARGLHQARPDPVDHGDVPAARAHRRSSRASRTTLPPAVVPARSARRSSSRSARLPHEVFAMFEPVPILPPRRWGQVHEARNAAGDRLAVKILYPNVVTIINVDLRVLGWALARLPQPSPPPADRARPRQQLGDMLVRETDLANDGALHRRGWRATSRAIPRCGVL